MKFQLFNYQTKGQKWSTEDPFQGKTKVEKQAELGEKSLCKGPSNLKMK